METSAPLALRERIEHDREHARPAIAVAGSASPAALRGGRRRGGRRARHLARRRLAPRPGHRRARRAGADAVRPEARRDQRRAAADEDRGAAVPRLGQQFEWRAVGRSQRRDRGPASPRRSSTTTRRARGRAYTILGGSAIKAPEDAKKVDVRGHAVLRHVPRGASGSSCGTATATTCVMSAPRSRPGGEPAEAGRLGRRRLRPLLTRCSPSSCVPPPRAIRRSRHACDPSSGRFCSPHLLAGRPSGAAAPRRRGARSPSARLPRRRLAPARDRCRPPPTRLTPHSGDGDRVADAHRRGADARGR